MRFFEDLYNGVCIFLWSSISSCSFKSILYCVLIFSFPLILSSTLHAQPVQAQESLELKLITLEQQFDRQVIGILNNYFDSQKFFVDVNLEATIVDETYTTTQNQIVKTPREPVSLPGMPFLPEDNLQPEQLEGNESTQTIVNESTLQRFLITGLNVNIYADSSFTAQEIDFMSLIAGIAAKINENRGDQVNVYQFSMPAFSSTPEPQVIDLRSDEDGLFGSLKDYIPGLFLLLLVGLTLLISRFTNSNKQELPDHRKRREDFKTDPQPESKSFSAEEPSSTHKSTSGIQSEFDYITKQFLHESKEVALLFEYWVEEDVDDGLTKAAKVVNTIDKHLVKALKREIDPEIYSELSKKVYEMPPLSLQEKKEVASSFIEALNNGIEQKSKPANHTQLSLFQFLDHVNENQIIQLLEGEDRITTALIIDYLPEGKAQNLINKLGNNRTTEVMLGMAEIDTLSYNEHKEISSRLFSEMMDIMEVEKEAERGLENVLSILSKLPLREQKNYIEQLKATGSELGSIVENRFITIDDIYKIDTEIIKKAVTPIPTEILLQALTGLKENNIDHVLSVRPKREQTLIRLELQKVEDTDTSENEEAKNVLMDAIRTELQK